VTHRSAAMPRAAIARAGASETVVGRELFSRPDLPEAVQKDSPTDPSHGEIRIATVVDELSAASSHRAIDLPVPVETDEVSPLRFSCQKLLYGTPRDFPVADPLAGVLDHSLGCRDHFSGENSKPVNRRTSNVHPKTRTLRVDARNRLPQGHLKTLREGVAKRIRNPDRGHSNYSNLILMKVVRGIVCCRDFAFFRPLVAFFVLLAFLAFLIAISFFSFLSEIIRLLNYLLSTVK